MQWPTFIKLGMWVVVGRSATQVVCCHWMGILNSSFAYLFWLANNKKGKYWQFCLGYNDETWYVGSNGLKYYSCALLLSMRILSTSFACLFWWANNKNCKYPEFCMGYSDETWYVGHGRHSYYPVVCHQQICVFNISFAYLFWLANKKRQISRVLYRLQWRNLVCG